MRTSTRFVLIASSLLASACTAPNGSFDGGAADLVALPDLAAPPRDFATAASGDLAKPLWGCDEVATCALGCGTDQGCELSCYDNGTPHAQALIQALAACLGATCTAQGGGLGRCVTYPGDTSLDCTLCLDNASAGGVTGVLCAPANDSACGRCSNESETCLLDQ